MASRLMASTQVMAQAFLVSSAGDVTVMALMTLNIGTPLPDPNGQYYDAGELCFGKAGVIQCQPQLQ